MKRSGYLQRKTPLRATKPTKRKPRPKAERERIYGPTARIEWVKSLPCLICARTPSENAHVGNGGTGRKADYTQIVPLCGDGVNGHHREYDTGKQSFAAKYKDLLVVPLARWAEITENAWQYQQVKRLTSTSAIVPGVVQDILERSGE